MESSTSLPRPVKPFLEKLLVHGNLLLCISWFAVQTRDMQFNNEVEYLMRYCATLIHSGLLDLNGTPKNPVHCARMLGLNVNLARRFWDLGDLYRCLRELNKLGNSKPFFLFASYSGADHEWVCLNDKGFCVYDPFFHENRRNGSAESFLLLS